MSGCECKPGRAQRKINDRIDNPSGGFPMKRFLRVVPFLAMAILVASPAYSQSASISGKVLGRDGQPAQGVILKIDSLTLNNGRLQIRESLDAKTGKNGEYSKSGLYNGRVMVSVIENGQVIMTAGEKV